MRVELGETDVAVTFEGETVPGSDTALTLVNAAAKDNVLLIERAGWNADIVLGSAVATMPDFLDLFATEAPAAGVELSVSTLTVLFSDLTGSTALYERVGVWSMYRYGDPAESDEARQLCLRRMLKVAGHETGHMLGIPHCTAWECGMNGSNSLPETDSQPLAFCHHCAAKVWWAMDVQPEAWYQSLAGFAREQGLEEEEEVWEERRDKLR